jgi:hypothetical protein
MNRRIAVPIKIAELAWPFKQQFTEIGHAFIDVVFLTMPGQIARHGR